MSGERYMADSRTKVVHDLVKEENECRIDEIVRAGKELPFKRPDEAHKEGYMDCSFCMVASKMCRM